MALLIQEPVYRPWIGNVAFGRNHIAGPVIPNIFPNRPGAIGPVCQHGTLANSDLFQQFNSVKRIVGISSGEKELYRVFQTVSTAWSFVFHPPLVRPTALSAVFSPPFGESGVHRLPGAIGLRQLTPLSTAPDDPEHPVEHDPVILPGAAPLSRFFRWQQRLDSFPLFFC